MIPKYESLTVEFKSSWNEKKDRDPIKKTIVAFANTAGGDLYIGVDDSGQVVGLSDVGRIEEKLASIVRDCISPFLAGFVVTERLEIGDKTVLKIHVDQGNMRPYCLDPKSASGIYVRIGNTSSPASIDDIAKMVRESNPVPFEDRIAFEQDLTFDYCQNFCRQRGLEFDPKTNLAYGFWNQKAQAFTNLAYICSDQSQTSEVLIHFADDEKLNILSSKRITGSIFELYDKASAFIAESNYAWMEKPSVGNAERVDHYFIEPRVILEALINMLAHRDYSKKPANLIHITPSCVELTSIGGLIDGLCLDDIVETMATECRNHKLAMLFNALRLMESSGSGFRRIKSFYKDKSIDELLSVSETSFTIRLPRRMQNIFLERKDFKDVLDFVGTHRLVSRKQIQDFLGIAQATAITLIRDMIRANLLDTVGAGRSTRYRVKNS